MKKTIGAILAVFVAWVILDYVLHQVILKGVYAKTPDLWRPEEEMILWLMFLVILIVAIAFVMIFARFFARKTLMTGLAYGLWWGLGAGVSMGYGTYGVMPIPYPLALGWFLGTLVEGAVAGCIVGAIFCERKKEG